MDKQVVGQYKISRLTSYLNRISRQVDLRHTQTQDVVPIFQEMVLKVPVRSGPHRKIATVWLRNISQIENGQHGKAPLVYAFFHAICAAAQSIQMTVRFPTIDAGGRWKSQGNLGIRDLLQVSRSNQFFGRWTHGGSIEQISEYRLGFKFLTVSSSCYMMFS